MAWSRWNRQVVDVIWRIVRNGETKNQAYPRHVGEEVEEDKHAAFNSARMATVPVTGVAYGYDTGAGGEQEIL